MPPTSQNAAELSSTLTRLNRAAAPGAQVTHLGGVPFGPELVVQRFRLGNGLTVLLAEDHSSPTVAYHTWFKVGSRNESKGKTGIAHLFEHLMFNETESLAAGEFDRKLEELGAESNASTWLDWTQYNIAVPQQSFEIVVELEADRMRHLVLQEALVESEKEVVANERRYRVDDDVEGALSELLWGTAFETHSYSWPTIGFMEDIVAFTVQDCQTFYRTYYSPNNATVVIVGDVSCERALGKVQECYGRYAAAEIPARDIPPEPVQLAERRREMSNLTPTWKVTIGYKSPPLSHEDHLALSVLCEVLFGGRSSRLIKLMVRERELASEVRGFVSPFIDAGLFEIFVNARGGVDAMQALAAIDDELEQVRTRGIQQDELERARARIELGLLQGLSSNEGKASTMGFYEVVLDDPSAGFNRLEALGQIGVLELQAVAQRYLKNESRTVVSVRPQAQQPQSQENP